MKKTMIIALAVMAGALLNTADAKKKKEAKKAAEVETVKPLELSSSSDTLSYAAGMMLTDGLMPYLKQSGVDTAYMAKFIEGFETVANAGDNPEMKAYVMGMEIANRMKEQMLGRMKSELKDAPDSIIDAIAYRGFVDGLTSNTAVYDTKRASEMFKLKFEAAKKAKEEKLYGPNRDAGRAFLAENAKKDSVVTLPSGLQYKVLVKGNGEVPKATDKVLVNYEGRLIDGTVFDASKKHGDKPAEFKPSQVIKGWTEALTMMPVGSKWELYIPYELAYGERNTGSIKPYSALIFTVELVGIDNGEKKAEEKKENTQKTIKKTVTSKKKVMPKRK